MLLNVRKGGGVFWWGLLASVVAIASLLVGLYIWASRDPGIDHEIAKEHFQADQSLRGLHRSSGAGCTTSGEGNPLHRNS